MIPAQTLSSIESTSARPPVSIAKVVSQISRQWKINLPHLRLLAREAWDLAEGMDITYSWIPREENKRADMLSNEGIDGAK